MPQDHARQENGRHEEDIEVVCLAVSDQGVAGEEAQQDHAARQHVFCPQGQFVHRTGSFEPPGMNSLPRPGFARAGALLYPYHIVPSSSPTFESDPQSHSAARLRAALAARA